MPACALLIVVEIGKLLAKHQDLRQGPAVDWLKETAADYRDQSAGEVCPFATVPIFHPAVIAKTVTFPSRRRDWFYPYWLMMMSWRARSQWMPRAMTFRYWQLGMARAFIYACGHQGARATCREGRVWLAADFHLADHPITPD